MARPFVILLLVMVLAACAADELSVPPPGTGGTGSTNTNTTPATNTNTNTNTNTTPVPLHSGAIELGTPALPAALVLTDNTALSTNDRLDSYAGYIQDESGPECVWRFTIAGWTLFTGALSGMGSGVDIDLHLCRAGEDGLLPVTAGVGGNVIARNNTALKLLLPPGTYYLSADSYQNKAGAFTLQLGLSDMGAAVRPLPVGSFTAAAHDSWSTTGSPLDAADTYSGYPQDESGPEVVYNFTLDSAAIFTAGLYDIQAGADIDLHLLPAGPFGTLAYSGSEPVGLIVRDDVAFRADLAAGSYFLFADSYAGKAGTFSLRTEFRASGTHIWGSYADLGRTLATNEVGPAVWTVTRSIDWLTAHRVTDYRSVVCPPDHWVAGMEEMSGCALTAAFVWRALGIYDTRIWDAYVVGSAVWNLHEIGNAHGCLRSSQSLDTYPGYGDTVDIVGEPNTDHVFMITSPVVKSGNTITFSGLNGGGVTADGKQLIREKVSTAIWNGTKWQMVESGKVISWWVKTDQLPRTLNARLPVDAPSFFP